MIMQAELLDIEQYVMFDSLSVGSTFRVRHDPRRCVRLKITATQYTFLSTYSGINLGGLYELGLADRDRKMCLPVDCKLQIKS